MRFDKEVWSAVWEFIKSSVFSFLLFYFAFDMWHLSTGDMRPLIKKGIWVEWLVHSQVFILRWNSMTPSMNTTDVPIQGSGSLTRITNQFCSMMLRPP